MSGSTKLPRNVRTQLGLGAFLVILGFIWLSVILYVIAPDQILPTRDDVRAAYDAFIDAANAPPGLWSLSVAGSLIAKGSILVVLDILFVVARYGGLTLLFLGGFAVFDAISNLRRARQ
jgi:hypothetical protein